MVDERLSPLSNMLINGTDSDVISLGPGSPIPGSPISLSSNTYPDTFTLGNKGTSPLSVSSGHMNGISLYTEANAQSKVCRPVLCVKRRVIGEEVREVLISKYNYLFGDMGGGGGGDTETKLKEFMQVHKLLIC